ncbi:16S rRNA (guanine(966)-N(2))-methyltransferase RsmD [Neofamilia massiliensis]|uniref:16S rRNA (guanine(966)-N(2))-methyltransferase RsmD n=1 Tax=Neofamilia massiliensis TaxID=1673724 RepID=UPI0006BB7105|nr:16S rRNA (guanine(966)-N(2))-methyltransferase RsmD [Neofamilia massiliensis]
MRIITGKRKGLKLNSNKNFDTRPTEDRIKESVFNILGNVSESLVLDLFAGTGNIGLEFLSRGAKEVYLVDNNKDAINVINKNVEKINLPGCKIIKSDYIQALRDLSNIKFNYIYIDPPYQEKNIYEASLKNIASNKNFKKALVIVETDKNMKLDNLSLFKILDQRTYRSTVIYFLKEEEVESNLSREL